MTSAPDTLLAARRLLLQHLDMQPGRTVASDLDPAEVGIVGDPDHVGGYHCGVNRVRRVDGVIRDYSVTESDRDLAGLGGYACALDVGEFRRTVGGRAYDLPHLSAWIVAQCKAGAGDARDIREVIWSPDGRTVRRWDRLNRRTTGDSSHRWHTHISYHRDAIKAGRDQSALFRRYLTTIGLLAGEDDDVTEEQIIAAVVKGVHSALKQAATPAEDRTGATGRQIRGYLQAILAPTVDLEALDGDELTAVLAGPAGQALADRVIAGLGGKSPADVAQALVAAGQNPGALAAALTALAADPDRRRG